MPGFFSRLAENKLIKGAKDIGKAYVDYSVGAGKAIGELATGTARAGEKMLDTVVSKPLEKAKILKPVAKEYTADALLPEKETFKGKNTAEKIGKTVGDIASAIALSYTTGGASIASKAQKGVQVAKSIPALAKEAQVAAKSVPTIKTALQKGAQKAISSAPGIAKEAAREGLEGAVYETAKQGEIGGEAAEAGALSAAFRFLPASKAATKGLSLLGDLTGGILKRLATVAGNTNEDVVKRIFANPEQALVGLTADPAELQTYLAKQAIKDVGGIRKSAREGYDKFLENLPTAKSGTPESAIVEYNGETIELNKSSLRDFVKNSFEKFNVLFDPEKPTLTVSQSTLNDTEEKMLKNIVRDIENWKDLSPKGINQLAIKVGNYAGDTTDAFNSLVWGLKGSIREYLGEKIPAVATENARYAEELGFAEELDGVFGTKEGAKNVSKVAQKLATLFVKNKGTAQGFAQALGERTGTDYLSQEAGRQLAEGVSKTATNLGETLKQAINILIPPKMVGKMVALSGRGKKIAELSIDEIRQALGDDFIRTVKSVYRAVQESANVPVAAFANEFINILNSASDTDLGEYMSTEDFQMLIQKALEDVETEEAVESVETAEPSERQLSDFTKSLLGE